jgi:predicted nucleotidyltransferase
MQKIMNHTLTASRLISDRQIEALSKQIAERFSPEKIILFGSYAYGVPHDSSDVDLLIVMEFTGRKLAKRMEIWKQVQPTFATDLLIRSPSEMIWRYEQLHQVKFFRSNIDFLIVKIDFLYSHYLRNLSISKSIILL